MSIKKKETIIDVPFRNIKNLFRSEKNHVAKNEEQYESIHLSFIFIFHHFEEKKSFSTVQQVVTHDDYSHTCQDWRHWSHDMCDSWEHACRSLTTMTTGPWLLCRGTSVNMAFIIGKRYSERKMAIATVCTRAFEPTEAIIRSLPYIFNLDR